ncbi:hypothetical protein MTR_4g028050 [Medicago truncatula]|uniref:Uncharacterized protein n=1 Tax=Medicago truncatula TaxID=3880 RepID=G7JIA4_MEDTR|nr:hypothetical protein MTR_4g028050 [Medicago truncatula]
MNKKQVSNKLRRVNHTKVVGERGLPDIVFARANWLGYVYDETHVDSFVQTQLPIEKHIEAALVEDGYARQSVLEKIDQIRGFLFYPEGRDN